jgi:hypothetical protein
LIRPNTLYTEAIKTSRGWERKGSQRALITGQEMMKIEIEDLVRTIDNLMTVLLNRKEALEMKVVKEEIITEITEEDEVAIEIDQLKITMKNIERKNDLKFVIFY